MIREGTRVRWASVGALACLLVCLAPGIASARPDVRARDSGPLAWRREVLSMMNEARVDADLPRLRINRGLSRNAQSHTRKMIAERRVFRTDNVDDLVEPYGATLWAEELARGRTLEANIRAWLHHADTRRHLLDPRMRHAAIGVQFANGRYWVTVYLHN
jgi:uncharacterized protein YkwD